MARVPPGLWAHNGNYSLTQWGYYETTLTYRDDFYFTSAVITPRFLEHYCRGNRVVRRPGCNIRNNTLSGA